MGNSALFYSLYLLLFPAVLTHTQRQMGHAQKGSSTRPKLGTAIALADCNRMMGFWNLNFRRSRVMSMATKINTHLDHRGRMGCSATNAQTKPVEMSANRARRNGLIAFVRFLLLTAGDNLAVDQHQRWKQ